MPTKSDLIKLVQSFWSTSSSDLSQAAEEARRLRDQADWFWNVLVTSFCTMGGSANWDRKREKYGAALHWPAVAALSAHERDELFRDLPNPRRRHMAEPGLKEAFLRIEQAGGPAAIANHYDELTTARERIRFLQSFRGIGAKYSRNIPMDVFDPLVRNNVALDARIHGILDRIEDAPPRQAYKQREDYLRDVRVEAGLPDMWFLDRLLYRHSKEIAEQLG